MQPVTYLSTRGNHFSSLLSFFLETDSFLIQLLMVWQEIVPTPNVMDEVGGSSLLLSHRGE